MRKCNKHCAQCNDIRLLLISYKRHQRFQIPLWAMQCLYLSIAMESQGTVIPHSPPSLQPYPNPPPTYKVQHIYDLYVSLHLCRMEYWLIGNVCWVSSLTLVYVIVNTVTCPVPYSVNFLIYIFTGRFDD